ncbi:MAG: helix-turn-helix transcriptional regulator [Nitrospira sp.]|nr:helix-turn-helix transcriptional regulator [Nitrospira sp.]
MRKFKGSISREKRRSKNLTQIKLAKKIGKSPITVIRFEKETRIPDSNTLIKLAEIFNCKCEDFFE